MIMRVPLYLVNVRKDENFRESVLSSHHQLPLTFMESAYVLCISKDRVSQSRAFLMCHIAIRLMLMLTAQMPACQHSVTWHLLCFGPE